jgi:hypothetical protein
VPAWAQIAVSSNDHKVTQENGVTKNVANPPADSITILDLGAVPVKVVGTIDNVPGSVVGPPLSVAITPDESLALVASSSKLDPADPTKLAPDDRVTVIDLKDRKIIGTVKTGAGAAGISITKDGKPILGQFQSILFAELDGPREVIVVEHRLHDMGDDISRGRVGYKCRIEARFRDLQHRMQRSPRICGMGRNEDRNEGGTKGGK